MIQLEQTRTKRQTKEIKMNDRLNQLRKGATIEVNTTCGWVREIVFEVVRMKKTGIVYVNSNRSGKEEDKISDGYSVRQTRWFVQNPNAWRVAQA
jgi:4-hydroxy-3-methylbut-2-enyl diphosphate reductase IspH